MNLLNDRALARRLKEYTVSAGEKFIYFLCYQLFFTLLLCNVTISLMAEDGWIYWTTNRWDIALDICSIAATIFGTFFVYKMNATGDNKDFIERFLCLSIPVLIQCFSIALFLTALLYGTDIFYTEDSEEGSTFYDFIFTAILELYGYYRLSSGMKIAAH